MAMRLRSPALVQEIAKVASQESNLPFGRRWSPADVSFGPAGLALMFGQLDRASPGQNWDRVAHVYLTEAAGALGHAPPTSLSFSAFGGVTGIAFVTDFLSQGGARYQRLQRSLDALIFSYAAHLPEKPDQSRGIGFQDYDVITGPAGVGRYILSRIHAPGAETALVAVLRRLIFLSELREGRLGFYIAPEDLPTQQHRDRNPDGATDCGLAHGVPGPLAVLALAQLAGVHHPELRTAIRRVTDWLLAQRLDDDWGINWPYAAPLEGSATPRMPCRSAWCYGVPGVANALWLAGKALNDADVCSCAADALYTVASRPVEQRGIPSPTICHGVAGLLHSVMRFWNRTHDPRFRDFGDALLQQLLALHEPDCPAGFRDIELNDQRVNNPGFLEGTAGVILVLMAAATPAAPDWDRLLLLS